MMIVNLPPLAPFFHRSPSFVSPPLRTAPNEDIPRAVIYVAPYSRHQDVVFKPALPWTEICVSMLYQSVMMWCSGMCFLVIRTKNASLSALSGVLTLWKRELSRVCWSSKPIPASGFDSKSIIVFVIANTSRWEWAADSRWRNRIFQDELSPWHHPFLHSVHIPIPRKRSKVRDGLSLSAFK